MRVQLEETEDLEHYGNHRVYKFLNLVSVSLTLCTGKTESGLQSWVVCCLFPSLGSPLARWALPWGSAGGPGLVSALLQSHGGAVTLAQPPGQENCFLCAQEAPHDGAAELIPSAMWLCSPPPPCLPSARLVRGSHGWSSAGKLTATCSCSHSTLVLTASKLVLP